MLGAICGDILGSPFEFEEIKRDNISEIELFRETNHIKYFAFQKFLMKKRTH